MNLTDANRHWTAVLGELQLSMTRGTFDTWLRGSTVIAYNPPILTVNVRHAHGVEWLQHRLMNLIERLTRRRFPPDTTITLTCDTQDTLTAEAPAETGAGANAEPTPIDDDPAQQPAPIPRAIRDFDPNTKDSGGFSMIGNYANNFWAPYLGTVPWRIYTLIYATDKRADKSKHDWTRPKSMSISYLARAVPSSRNAIRGRWRTLCDDCGQETRQWRPGAFDTLTVEGLALIEWHDADPRWRRWYPGGPAQHSDAAGQRYIYRLSVRTTLPLLSPRQVAALPADMRAAHEAYLLTQQVDIVLWDQIRQPSLLPVDQMIITGATAPLTGATAPLTGATAPVNGPFFRQQAGTQARR